MQASFIIPLYNCLAHTRACLRTLQATLPAGLAHEILLVDDGSTDGTRDWLATLGPPCRALLNEHNLGFAGACNRAAAETRGDALFFLNNDLVLRPGWFEPMAAALLTRRDAGLVGNVQLDAATRAVDHAGVFFTHQAKPAHVRDIPLTAQLRLGPTLRPVPAVTGACFAMARGLWQQLGGFDTGYRNGGEDIDLALRASAAGRTNLVALDSIVLHHVSTSPGRKLRDEQNTWRLFQRWQPELARLARRDWCRHYLEQNWDGARRADDFVAAAGALAYWLGLRRTVPLFVDDGVQAAIATELRRWRTLGLDGAG
jgi:GT2 family glycosyltransferase